MGPVIDALGLCSITLVFSGLVEAIVTSYYLNVVVALSVGILLGATFWSLIIIQGRKVEINI
jgi:energy-converting hydrogenase Eha subunit C